MNTTTQQNKEVVLRFNKEFIEQGNMNSFAELVAGNVVNHAAPPGTPSGPDSMLHFLQNILRKGFPDMKVEILDQIAEGDKVTTRKVIRAKHTGECFGIAPSGKDVAIHVIDIIRLHNGKYAEHWGMSNFSEVIAQISQP